MNYQFVNYFFNFSWIFIWSIKPLISWKYLDLKKQKNYPKNVVSMNNHVILLFNSLIILRLDLVLRQTWDYSFQLLQFTLLKLYWAIQTNFQSFGKALNLSFRYIFFISTKRMNEVMFSKSDPHSLLAFFSFHMDI